MCASNVVTVFVVYPMFMCNLSSSHVRDNDLLSKYVCTLLLAMLQTCSQVTITPASLWSSQYGNHVVELLCCKYSLTEFMFSRISYHTGMMPGYVFVFMFVSVYSSYD